MGGKGSGHYRHAGRKGKQGGSAPSKRGGVSFFHGTRKQLLDKILTEGLKPGKKRHKRSPAVYVAEDPALAHSYALNNATSKSFEKGDIVEGIVFEINVPESELGKLTLDEKNPGLMFPHAGGESWYTEKGIPPEWIKSYTVYQLNVDEYFEAPWGKRHETFEEVEHFAKE